MQAPDVSRVRWLAHVGRRAAAGPRARPSPLSDANPVVLFSFRRCRFGGESSEERRVGKECVSTCRSRWSPDHSQKKPQTVISTHTEPTNRHCRTKCYVG